MEEKIYYNTFSGKIYENWQLKEYFADNTFGFGLYVTIYYEDKNGKRGSYIASTRNIKPLNNEADA